MSQWGGPPRSPTSDAPPASPTTSKYPPRDGNVTPLPNPPISADTPDPYATDKQPAQADQPLPQTAQQTVHSRTPSRTPSRARGDSRVGARPLSMIQTYQPPQMDVAQDTPPELQPIFSFLNSHSNKLYQEGYFLKLHDLDTRGRPSPDRTWNECFAQLVGTVLSLWDAAALDVAGEDAEVVPTFINLSDASIKMIESLPMNGAESGTLQNVLSISTAANNRYLLHFNSLNSLTQWTAGIRLAMFEHSTLQEAYTGSLIAGKGRFLNNIKAIMERSRFVHEDWARVRFGAGTPWKRYWCVISPPDDKEFAKAQKTLKKTSSYERARLPKGNIKFYDTRKVTKKTRPVATINDAFAAYAIYPQSKPLIDQSTLVKLEGLVTIHTAPETTTEGFVFVMPEVHAAVTGFEMMLRWLFPVYDTFGLYGRPTRLIADILDQRGLMFAMPRDRRYGYLDTLDVSGLIHTEGSQAWSERQWRREMKKLTSSRMMTYAEKAPRISQQYSQRRNTTSRNSLPATKGGVKFTEEGPTFSSPVSRTGSPVLFPGAEDSQFAPPRRTDSAPPAAFVAPHKRSASDAQGYQKYTSETPSRLSHESRRFTDDEGSPPPPPRHAGAYGGGYGSRTAGPGTLARIHSGAETPTLSTPRDEFQNPAPAPSLPPPQPVLTPPAFTHSPSSRPATQPYQAPELRRAHSNVDAATLYQMQDAVRTNDAPEEEWSGEVQHRQQNPVATNSFATRGSERLADPTQGMVSGAAIAARKQHDPRQRLSTIEGSPYVGAGDPGFQTFNPGHESTTEERTKLGRSGDNRPSLPTSLQSSHSINRKPVPKRRPTETVATPSPPLPLEEDESPPSHGSFVGAIIDNEALERILNDDPSRLDTMRTEISTATPDYASTVSSDHEPKVSIEKPRAGKLKMIGDPEYQPPRTQPGAGKFDPAHAIKPVESDMPVFDFGPTYSYKPTSRPSTSGTMTPAGIGNRSRSRSTDRLRSHSRDRLSTYGAVNGSPDAPRHPKTPSPNGLRPGEQLTLTTSVPWQPTSVSPGGVIQHRQTQSLTPEQWVQQRASMASVPHQVPPRKPTPTAAHTRQPSTSSVNKLRKTLTKTPPPLSRTPSGDWTPKAQTPPSRPTSRGAASYLHPQVASAQNSNLTAREQMHVARATGSPLIQYTSRHDRQNSEQFAPGLFGALAARQKEKENMKPGSPGNPNVMVQSAIAARQQQIDAEAAAHAQAQMQYQMQYQQQAQAAQFQELQYRSMLLAQQQQQQQQQYQQQAQMRPPSRPSSQMWPSQHPPSPGYAASQYNGRASPSFQQQWERQQALMQGGSSSFVAQQQQPPRQQGTPWGGSQRKT
nr:protein skg3 [Quercus suber]